MMAGLFLWFFFRALPFVQGSLPAAGQSELIWRAVSAQSTAGTGGGTVANGDWRYQHVAGTDAYLVADDSTVFIDAVVVASDGAGTDIGLFANGGIAQIGKVVSFAAIANGAVFDFNKVADVYGITNLCLWSQTSKRTNLRVAADNAVI